MRYLMTVSYDGTNYNGYQKQKKDRSIQEEIENILSKINNKKIVITASGRTDKGVHALNQKIHFDLNKNIKPNKLKKSINSLLSDDIYVKDIIEVDNEFHARYDVFYKTYEYKINTGNYNPLDKNYIYQYNKPLNIKKMKKELKSIIGKHNFKSFTVNYGDDYDYYRTILKTKIKIDKDIITISITGTGFMRYMVRNIVGTIIEIGENKNISIKEILDYKDRTKAGKTAPSSGLYLVDVKYNM